MQSISRIYLDHNATSPLRPEAREAMLAALGSPFNPSSVHTEGRKGKSLLESARETIARGIGGKPKNLIFTASATEAANLALTPALLSGQDRRPIDRLLIAGGEHPAIFQGHRFSPQAIEILPLEKNGQLSLEALQTAISRYPGKKLALALQAVNNETGVIQPIEMACDLIKKEAGIFICDATQAIGRVELSLETVKADLLFFSSHKLGGPAGAGALIIASDDLAIQDILIKGGGQEAGRRAGTENIPAVVGFAAAFKSALADLNKERPRLKQLQQDVEDYLVAIGSSYVVFGQQSPRSPNTVTFAIPEIDSQTLLIALDLAGVAVSSGSACSSGKVKESHVLSAMGVREKSALRISLGWSSTKRDVEEFGIILKNVVRDIHSRRSGLPL
ncbi:cysteine desulfurase [Methylocystaceae bacterium]|nr:cysteine desulfurase [Methylocystaceae bacterium]